MPIYDPILIVDDDPKLRFTLSVILKRAGYPIAAVPCAKDALRFLQCYAFSMMILDLMLPDMDGLSLLSTLRRSFPKLPVMILTGDDSLESTVHALKLGACGVLLKPINPPQILSCVANILQNKSRRIDKQNSRIQNDIFEL
jgi:DNA-binding response OmpR family regulator